MHHLALKSLGCAIRSFPGIQNRPFGRRRATVSDLLELQSTTDKYGDATERRARMGILARGQKSKIGQNSRQKVQQRMHHGVVPKLPLARAERLYRDRGRRIAFCACRVSARRAL
jgi:hypothetical protein